MNGEVGIKIDAGPPPTAAAPEPARNYSSKRLVDVWEFARGDRNRVTYPLKVGLSVLVVALLSLLREPYEVFGANVIYSIFTAVLMFEYTVGATFNRGFNRAVGSLVAVSFALMVIQLAEASGRVAEPYIIGFSIFLVGTVTSFMKLWPSIIPYEYSFRVTLFTYCLIIVSGYRMGYPMKTAMSRLYSIAMGGVIAVLVNVLVFPIWAGEQLHKELVGSFTLVADSLEECVNKYLTDDGLDAPGFSKTAVDDFMDEPAFRKCRSTLTSSAKLESLANSAKWEPPHGRFRQFFYPWLKFVRVGAVLRHCAYELMALHGCLHSEIQAPYNLRAAFRSEILEATKEAAELLRNLGSDLNDMKRRPQTSLLKRVHSATEQLQRSIDLHSYLLTSSHELYYCPAKPSGKLSNPPSFKLSNPPSFNLKDFSSNTEPGYNVEPNGLPVVILQQAETYHESMKRQQRRLHSWPSREVDEFEEDGDSDGYLIRRMHTLESTTALSLATFTSLLIEFVARLDHLVDAVDELARMARFDKECRS